MILESNETIVQGDIIIVKKGEAKKLFTMAGLPKAKNSGKRNAIKKDVVRDANRYWDTTTIPYWIWPGLRKYIHT